MKLERCGICARLGCLMFIIAFAGIVSAQSMVLSDFDDGTMQGWGEKNPFGGTLSLLETGGNPGGCLLITDDVGGGGGLLVCAPESYHGDLTGYDGIQWDEYIYAHGTHTLFQTYVDIEGADGTIYGYGQGPYTVLEQWNTRFTPFDDPSSWVLYQGTSSFSDVLANVVEVCIHTDVSDISSTECSLDNIILVPEPATIALLSMGLLFTRRK